MGKMNFYVLYSLRDAPRQFFSKSNRQGYQVHVPLPLPKQVVVFGLGEWQCSETTISVEVVVSAEVPAQRIGTLTSQSRCLTWEGEWSPDIVSVAAERGRRGVYGKVVLTMCGEASGFSFQAPDKSSIFSSTPMVERKCLFPDKHNAIDLSSTLHPSIANETMTTDVSHFGESVSYAEIQVNKVDTTVSTIGDKLRVWPAIAADVSHLGESTLYAEIQVNKMDTSVSNVENKQVLPTVVAEVSHLGESDSCAEIQVNKIDTSMRNKPSVWPTAKTPKCTVIGKRGRMMCSSEDMDCLAEDIDQDLTPKRMRMSRINSQDNMSVQIKSGNREVSACPSERWSHTMCLTDHDTAILIGGATTENNYCKDSLWKLELDNDFWFPINSPSSGPVPPCAGGHSATYDPDSQSIFVYGGLREGQCYSELYILDTLTWKWKLVKAKGNVPNLAYHSASFYKKELFVFGGVQPSPSSADKPCSNALYIFNPEYELWYQPIVEGERPLPRFGHSATLLLNKLIIFGGKKTATYLNDLHVLDLGFMEYTAVKCGNMPPLPRGFHAAVPVSDNRILISGGCSAIGALQDVHIFNTDTNMWSLVACPLLCSRARAGHSLIHLGCSVPADAEKTQQGKNVLLKCNLLVFGGSDCSGTFYNDTVKCIVDIPADK